MVTTIKHNFSSFGDPNMNPIWSAMIEVNNTTNFFLAYSILALVFIVSSYVITKRINDSGKALVSSLHITSLLAILMFYAGKVSGTEFLPAIVLLFLLIVESISLASIYMVRMGNT